jgi:hypothetical protein
MAPPIQHERLSPYVSFSHDFNMKYNDDFWAVEACLHGKRGQGLRGAPRHSSDCAAQFLVIDGSFIAD